MNLRLCLGVLILVAAPPAFGQPPPETLEIRALVAGTITKVHVKAGDAIQEGDLLVEIESTALKAALSKAEARRELAQARLNQHRAELDRAKRLIEGKALSRQEYDKVVEDHAVGAAVMKLATAEVDAWRALLEKTKVRATTDGKVVRVFAIVGASVVSDALVLTIIPANAAVQAKPSAKVKDLMKERLAALTQIADLVEKRMIAGVVTEMEVLHARRAVVDAALGLAETPAARLDLLRKDVELTEALLKRIEDRVKTGTLPETEVHRARVMHLDARIRLLREEEASKPGGR
jgi:multidrug efflux pump subunit AcrA (membrane-fusion protein)